MKALEKLAWVTVGVIIAYIAYLDSTRDPRSIKALKKQFVSEVSHDTLEVITINNIGFDYILVQSNPNSNLFIPRNVYMRKIIDENYRKLEEVALEKVLH